MAVFGHLDINAMYCSVERAFQPELRGQALVCLSNNDGCVIARSPEAKERGIAMGALWHELSRQPAGKGVKWRSSNYPLYGDMSRRMYEILAERVPQVEPYSIDEMFLDMDVPDPLALACQIREDVLRLVKLPSCVGLGPTKTIAKMANKAAKKDWALRGICDLRSPSARADLYEDWPVEEVWGIASRTAAKLALIGVKTVADFVRCDPRQVRDMLSVVPARLHAELRGISCLPLALMSPPKKCITVSRSFGQLVTGWGDLRDAVASFTARAAEKLRHEGLEAGRMAVFAHTHAHNGDEWHSIGRAAQIEPTADTRALISGAIVMLQPGWRSGFRYAKAGIMLDDLRPAGRQSTLLSTRDPAQSAKVMTVLDGINQRFGRNTLRIASVPAGRREWSMRQRNLSPRYTTRIEEILQAEAY